MGSNKYIITKNKCWPVFKQDPACVVRHSYILCQAVDGTAAVRSILGVPLGKHPLDTNNIFFFFFFFLRDFIFKNLVQHLGYDLQALLLSKH